jgi:uncharacterized protein YerC
MRRYHFLDKNSIYETLNQLRNAFLAAKDGTEVDSIIKAVLTFDERMKIGRRLIIAQSLRQGQTFDEIVSTLNVGKSTVLQVENQMVNNPQGFKIIDRRDVKVEKSYSEKAYQSVGGSTLWHKPKVYSGITRKQIKR